MYFSGLWDVIASKQKFVSGGGCGRRGALTCLDGALLGGRKVECVSLSKLGVWS